MILRLSCFLLLTALSATGVRAEDTVLKTAPVPNRMLKQGEAQLVKRDNAFGVRIELHTRHRELADLPPDYLKQNLILIMTDRFDLTKAEAQRLLVPFL